MDYKYIEQLLEQYWECQTTLEEEAILRSFFAQDDVPASLLPYKTIFQAQAQEKAEAHLGRDFDQHMMHLIDQRQGNRVSAKRVTMRLRLQPFFKVAAVLAVILSLGLAAQYGWQAPQEPQMAQGEMLDDSASIVPVDAATATAAQGKDSIPTLMIP